MIRAINSLPLGWALFAYGVLGWGLVVVCLFLTRYMIELGWRTTEEGRHLVAMSANVGAFFLIYVIQLFIPDWSWRPILMLVLLVALVVNCTWRWVLLEKHLKIRRRAAREKGQLPG